MKLIHIFGILVAMIFGSYLLVNFILPEPHPEKAEDKVVFAKKYNLPKLAATGYSQLIEQEPENPDHYFGLISQAKSSAVELNRLSVSFVRQAKQAPNERISNVAHLAAGLCEAALGDHFQAIFNFNKVSQVELKYLNYALGTSYKSLRQYSRARVYLEHECKLPQGFHEGAVRELFQLFSLTNNDSARMGLVLAPETRSLLHPDDVRKAAFAKGKMGIYLGAILRMLWLHFNVTGFLAALGVMLIWLVYLMKLDIFNPEKIQQLLVVLGLGMLMSVGVFIMADSRQLLLNLGDVAHGDNFFYWVLDVGIVEELVKIIPLLGLMAFTKWLDEPFDFILYASVSALGFAFVENGLYYDGIRLNIIHARAMTAVVGHMFHSSIIAYGIILCKYRYRHFPVWLGGILAFLLASLSHGLYDFLLGKGIYVEVLNKEVYPAFVLFFLLLILLWANIINNSLNQSPFFDYKHRLRPYKLMSYLVIALTAVLVFEYLTVGLHYGSLVANRSLLNASANGSFMILVLAVGLSRIELVKGAWRGIHWRGILIYSRTDEGRIRRIADQKRIIGSNLLLSAYAYNPSLKAYFTPDICAQVEKQLSLSLPEELAVESDWYEVALSTPATWDFALCDRVLLKFKSRDELKRKGESLALVLAIPQASLLAEALPAREDFQFLGWIKVIQP